VNKHVPLKLRRLDPSSCEHTEIFEKEYQRVLDWFKLPPGSEYLTVEQASAYLGVAPVTIRRYAREEVSQFKRRVVSRNEKTNKYEILIDIEGAVQYRLLPHTRRR
jgi:hypothetical protein